MKVKYLNEKEKCPFRDIEYGEAFCHCEETFIRVKDDNNTGYSAISASDGTLSVFDPDLLVEPLAAKLTVQKRRCCELEF